MAFPGADVEVREDPTHEIERSVGAQTSEFGSYEQFLLGFCMVCSRDSNLNQ